MIATRRSERLAPAELMPLVGAIDGCREGTYVRHMQRASSLTESRLDALYDAEGFGGDKTMRAKVFRELIDEIRALRRELHELVDRPASPPPWLSRAKPQVSDPPRSL